MKRQLPNDIQKLMDIQDKLHKFEKWIGKNRLEIIMWFLICFCFMNLYALVLNTRQIKANNYFLCVMTDYDQYFNMNGENICNGYR